MVGTTGTTGATGATGPTGPVGPISFTGTISYGKSFPQGSLVFFPQYSIVKEFIAQSFPKTKV